MSDRPFLTRRSVVAGAAALTAGSLAHANSSQVRPQASVVGACTVTDCKFYEDHECHAGEIEVRIGSTGAVCGTYTPDWQSRPRP